MEKKEKHVLTRSDLCADLSDALLGGHRLLAGLAILGCTLFLLFAYIDALTYLIFVATLRMLFLLLVSAYLTVHLLCHYAYYKCLIRRLSVFIDAEPSPLYNTEEYHTRGGRGSTRKERYRFVFPDGKWEAPQHPYPCLGEESLPNMNPERNKELHGQKYYLVRSKRGKILYAYPVLHFTLSDELSEYLRAEEGSTSDF